MSSQSSSQAKDSTSTPSIYTDQSEMSDVQCYTCRKRHIRCDRTLPTCDKCKKKGVPCLGYQKPLRWAEGVAVRGKLKGKSKPVVDTNIINMVQGTVQEQADKTFEKAAQAGVHITGKVHEENISDEHNGALQLLDYYNTTICAERVTMGDTKVLERHMTSVSPEAAFKLPKVIVDCILAIAAVHKANRAPDDKALEQLALERKVIVYQSYNRSISMPQHHGDLRPDAVVCVGNLIFAMDIIENGLNRWMMHFLGSLHVISCFGGIENLSFHYPHLQVSLFHLAHLETMWLALSHVAITKPKHTTRTALEGLCYSPLVRSRAFNPCPTALTMATWDMGACAQKLLGNDAAIEQVDMYKRDRILLDVLSFQPKSTSGNGSESEFNTGSSNIWERIHVAWKAATTILVLRHLYFGRSNLHRRSSSSLSLNYPGLHSASQTDISAYYQAMDEMDFSDYGEDFGSVEDIPDYLTPGMHHESPYSRIASPIPSPLPYVEPNDRLWDKRYEIHQEAFSVLSDTLAFLHDNTEPLNARYFFLPTLVLGLTSRPGSKERNVCLSSCARFENFMAQASTDTNRGQKLTCDIPWEALDAYSELISRESRNAVSSSSELLVGSAPEWNWLDMLKAIDLDMIWPVSAGTSHLECGSDYWAFQILSSVLTEECFSSWLQNPGSS